MLARHLRHVVMVLKAAQDSDINMRLEERRTCAGAMVMESPVWTPMGSTFSMEQMMTTLSARSRMTSSSYSFQPSSDFSISTCVRCRGISECIFY